MGLFTLIGACVLAETIGNKVHGIVEEKTIAESKTQIEINRMHQTTERENARLRTEIARMHEETERANARIRAEAKIEAERIRAAGMVATAALMNNRNYYDDTIDPFGFTPNNKSEKVVAFVPDKKKKQSSLDNQALFCDKCGSKVMPGSFFCRNCGNRIR